MSSDGEASTAVEKQEENSIDLETWDKNIFANEWEESDAVLLVENVRFHVHRAILCMFSPVFRAMFSSDFREKDQQEVPLPGKKADTLLSFLLLVYSREEYDEVTMQNVDALLALGDEYQVTRVTKECRKFLMLSSLDLQTAMTSLILAEKYTFPDVREKCYKILQAADLESLKTLKGFGDLDANSVREMLLPRLAEAQGVVKSLKASLQEVHKQLVGLLEFTVHLLKDKDRYMNIQLKVCSSHYEGKGKAKTGIEKRAKECPECRDMFRRVAELGFDLRGDYSYRYKEYNYGYDTHFDRNVIDVVVQVANTLRKLP